MKFSFRFWLVVCVFAFILQACGAKNPVPAALAVPTKASEALLPTSTVASEPSETPSQFFAGMPTQTPNLTATQRAMAWKTSQAGPTKVKPTRTPNLAATQQVEERQAEVQAYFDKGYLSTTDGAFREMDDFKYSWAQLGWYHWQPLTHSAGSFFMSAHFKWSSAYRSADISGCGFAFAIQPNGDQYAVFLDRSKILFAESKDSYFYPMGTTHGTGRVNFGNPFDEPVEADFTLIVKDAYAYVLVDGDVVGEYTLAQSKNLNGKLGLALLSGTNKDFGTRCEMTNLHAWIPNK